MLLKTILASTLVASLGFGAPAAIGIVTASGHFTLDRSQVWGNATLFEGEKLETDAASSEAVLNNGVRLQLGAQSSASVTENRLMLWKGVGQVASTAQAGNAPDYELEAAAFAVRPSPGSRVRVGLAPDGRIDVLAISGSANVVNRQSGVLLASVATGQRMTFAMQAGATGAVTHTGCLVFRDGRYLLQDQNSLQVSEITGTNLGPNVGNRVTVTGTVLTNARPGVSVATDVINATSVVLQQQGGCLSVASTLNASTTPPAGAGAGPAVPTAGPAKPAAPAGGAPKTGMSTGAKVAIVAVVAGGGAGAAIALAGGKKSTSP